MGQSRFIIAVAIAALALGCRQDAGRGQASRVDSVAAVRAALEASGPGRPELGLRIGVVGFRRDSSGVWVTLSALNPPPGQRDGSGSFYVANDGHVRAFRLGRPPDPPSN